MARINRTDLYPNTAPALDDHVPGTDVSDTSNDANGETVTFTVQDLQSVTGLNTITTNYTLALSDRAKAVLADSTSGAITVTIPANSAVAFPVGTVLNVISVAANTVSVTGDTGVTVNGVSAGSGDLSGAYVGVALLKTASDTWLVTGSIGAIS